jgi:hypothetical protein
MDWDKLANNQSVKRAFAEYTYDLSAKPVLLTIMLRLHGKYVFYDDSLKKYINMTANTYVEDLTKKPFKKTYSNYKGWRLCD